MPRFEPERTESTGVRTSSTFKIPHYLTNWTGNQRSHLSAVREHFKHWNATHNYHWNSLLREHNHKIPSTSPFSNAYIPVTFVTAQRPRVTRPYQLFQVPESMLHSIRNPCSRSNRQWCFSSARAITVAVSCLVFKNHSQTFKHSGEIDV